MDKSLHNAAKDGEDLETHCTPPKAHVQLNPKQAVKIWLKWGTNIMQAFCLMKSI